MSALFSRKSLGLIEICTPRQNAPTYAGALEANTNAEEIEIEDFQDLMNPRLCFQLGPCSFNVGLYPLSAATAASEIWIRRKERPAASMGAAAHEEEDERRGRGLVGMFSVSV